MGNIFTCIASSLTWCCCTASFSLLTSCCATEKGADVPPGAASGRKRSVFLLMLSIGLAFAFKYGVAPALQPDDESYAKKAPGVRYLVDTWRSGCEDYATDDLYLQEECSGISGVYRVAGSTLLFFFLASIAAYCKPSANREAWAAKYVLFLFLVTATIFIPNDPLFNPILMNVFRVGAVIFILFQQLIFIDMAYNVNESWVEKADSLDSEEGEGAGKKWIIALLSLCALFFIASLVAIGFMFHHFSGCTTNLVFISVTLVMGVVSTALQLTGEEASLFTSSAIFAYATYLCYVAVTKNPDAQCNPRLGENDVLGIILGISLTLLGLAWTGWSLTAHKALGVESDAEGVEESKDAGAKGTVLGEADDSRDYGSIKESIANEGASANTISNSWKLNAILCLLTSWFAMSLTSWGSIMNGGDLANPDTGKVSMWMVVCSQWVMLLLYVWTLIAPKLFPDRDFS